MAGDLTEDQPGSQRVGGSRRPIRSIQLVEYVFNMCGNRPVANDKGIADLVIRQAFRRKGENLELATTQRPDID